jgi:hypothetical protein
VQENVPALRFYGTSVLARIPQQNIVNGYDVAAINTHATPQ